MNIFSLPDGYDWKTAFPGSMAVEVDSPVSYGDARDITPNGESIIGLRDPTLTINATGTLTTTTFDTTTYGDRAIIKLTNATGSSINLTGLCIKGKPVMQLGGQNGYVWEYSDYDAMEKEGEKFVEVSNDFIFDPVQAKQVGDFVWKELKPHKLYSLMIVGCQYQYEIGDVYHLTLEHTMNGGTMENIDTDVEVMGVSINRSVGGVGMTNLNLRVPSEAWALTLARNSKLVGAGNAQRLNNRSNVVTVAASTWTGQADYFCDGTDDNVEIQAAIDYLDSIGGGVLSLTSGSFYFVAGITIKNNINFSGYGSSTIIYPVTSSPNSSYIITFNDNVSISYIVIDGSMATAPFNCIYTNSSVVSTIDHVEIRNITGSNPGGYVVGITALYSSVSYCKIYNLTSSAIGASVIGVNISYSCNYNVIDNITSTGGAQGIGVYGSKKCTQNKSTNCSTAKYSASYADSGTANPCADTAAGGYNS